MRAEIESVSDLRFDDGSPVRSASAIAPFGDGWLVAQDDATHAAWWRPGGVAALDPLYHRVAEALGIDVDLLNLEGACRTGETFRWFNRGNLTAGLPSASVDLDVAELVAALTGSLASEEVKVSNRHLYPLVPSRQLSVRVRW